MNLLVVILLSVVGGVALASIVAILVVAKQYGWTKESVISKIRPIISEALLEAIVIYQAGEVGYEELLEEVVTFLHNKIVEAEFLTEEEKAILSYDFILKILDPQLKQLWDSDTLDQLAEESMYLLQ